MADTFYIESGTGRQVSDLSTVNAGSTYYQSGTGQSFTGSQLYTAPVATNTFGQPITEASGSPVPTAPAPAPTPTAPATITSGDLSSTTPTTTFQQPGTPTPYPVSTLDATIPKPEPLTMTGPETQAQDLTTQLQDLYNQDTGQSAYRATEEGVYNVPELTKTYNDLAQQLTGLKNEAAAIPLQLQQGAADRGVTTPLLGAQENSRLRTNAIAALGVSTLLQAAQGNLAYAQTLVDKAVEQKYGPIEEQIKAKMANLQLILGSPAYSLADKNRAQQQLYIQQQQQTSLEVQKYNTQQTWGIATTAASNGANFKATGQYPTLAVALKAISEATSPQMALQIAASVNLVQAQTDASGTKILGSASTGYFSYDPVTGKTAPISATGSSSTTGTYKAGMLTTLLQSQGKTADDATLKSLWAQYGNGGTYTNDTAHNAVLYSALGGTYAASTSTTTAKTTSTSTSTPTTTLKEPKGYTQTQRTQLSGYLDQVSTYTTKQAALADLAVHATQIRATTGDYGYNVIKTAIDQYFASKTPTIDLTKVPIPSPAPQDTIPTSGNVFTNTIDAISSWLFGK